LTENAGFAATCRRYHKMVLISGNYCTYFIPKPFFIMKRKNATKLSFKKQTLTHLGADDVQRIKGGATTLCVIATSGCYVTFACATTGCITAGCGITFGCGSDFTRPGGR
jgi:hypothetical protein